jgi:hypothetical protein
MVIQHVIGVWPMPPNDHRDMNTTFSERAQFEFGIP